jgi:hypothetical protein
LAFISWNREKRVARCGKKQQVAFSAPSWIHPASARQRNKSFLVLFFKKELLSTETSNSTQASDDQRRRVHRARTAKSILARSMPAPVLSIGWR